MFFCPNCNNTFDITKNAPPQAGGVPVNVDYDKFINRILNDEVDDDLNVDLLSADDLAKNSTYKKLKSKQKDKVYNKLIELLPLEKKNLPKANKINKNIVYFNCTNCGYKEPVKDGTIVFSQTSGDVSQVYVSPHLKTMKHSDILLNTSKYICDNPNCVSHKDLEKREAAVMRQNNSYKSILICKACDTILS